MTLTNELVDWTYHQKCQATVEALKRNGFTATLLHTGSEARDYILREASTAESIGFGGSLSVVDLEVEAALKEAGKTILNHAASGMSPEERLETMHRQLSCDLFLSGANAVTLSGIIVNIDASGNRVGSMFFGPGKVIVVIGRNKLVDGSVEDAIRRVKEFASPPNARRLNFKTPCATTGICSDCDSPDRICRITTIIERKPRRTDIHVLVVNKDLGL